MAVAPAEAQKSAIRLKRGAMADKRREHFLERYGWVLVFANGVIWVVFGIASMLSPHAVATGTGYPHDAIRDLESEVQVLGAAFLPGAALQLAVGASAFRTRERWAWFALLSVPVFAALNSYFDSQLGVTGVLGIFFFFGGLTFVGLLLTIRAFFLRR